VTVTESDLGSRRFWSLLNLNLNLNLNLHLLLYYLQLELDPKELNNDV
jgi:hypothetical protein